MGSALPCSNKDSLPVNKNRNKPKQQIYQSRISINL